MKVVSKGKINRVYGGLLGLQTGKKIELYYAFEFYNQCEDDSAINLDIAYIDERKKMTEQLFPNYELLGFFTSNNGICPNDKDKEVIKAMDYFGVVSPICLVLSTQVEDAEELPIAAYEINKHDKKFLKLSHEIEGFESERICLDTVTKSTDIQNNESAMIQNMETLRNALGMLKGNMKIIRNALNDKEFQQDPVFISQIDDLVKNYPDVLNPDLLNLLHDKEEEILILNNICSSCINLSFQGRAESVSTNDDYRKNMFR